MAAKPMPRLRAGISGAPILSSAKRSLALHVKSKSEGRCPTRHSVGVASTTKKEPSVQIRKVFENAEDMSCSGHVMPPASQSTEEVHTATQSAWNKVCSQLEKNASLEKLRVSLDDSEPAEVDSGSEESRLKQLMLLQISLIGRQQDLLKLRDKEIMQLKQKTQSYKNRLERMDRRIQLSRRHVDTSMNLHQSEDASEIDALKKETESGLNATGAGDESLQNMTKSNVPSSSASQKQDFTGFNKFLSPLSTKGTSTSTLDMQFASPVSLVQSAYAASGCIPVPVSFVDRCKDQLSPYTVGNAPFQPVVIKVCEHCSQCAAIVSEIKKELPGSEEEGRPGGTKVVVTEQFVSTTGPSKDLEAEEVPMQTQHPYHLITWPRDDQSYRFTDLDLSIEEGSTLNIPTWRENKLTPLSSSSSPLAKETIDDDAFLKRHSRLEVSEKRRKRWDIQRIREYRYNEKLRQRKLKQSSDSSFETFAPFINDINAVQIEENLPVNAFGHLLQPLQTQEFSLDSNL